MSKLGTPVGVRIDVAERRTKAINLRRDGHTWEDIATQLGYADRGAACKDVSRALAARLAEQGQAADEAREIELERLDDLWRRALAVLTAQHEVIYQGEATGIPDDGPSLAAIDRLLRISDRRAKLLGLDAPTRVEGTLGAAGADAQVEALIAQVEAEGSARVGEA